MWLDALDLAIFLRAASHVSSGATAPPERRLQRLQDVAQIPPRKFLPMGSATRRLIAGDCLQVWRNGAPERIRTSDPQIRKGWERCLIEIRFYAKVFALTLYNGSGSFLDTPTICFKSLSDRLKSRDSNPAVTGDSSLTQLQMLFGGMTGSPVILRRRQKF